MKQLGLDYKTKKKELVIRPKGNFEDIKDFFDASRGDVMIEMGRDFKEPYREPVNNYKVVNISALYGSNKPCGELKKEIVESKYNSVYTRRKMSRGRQL